MFRYISLDPAMYRAPFSLFKAPETVVPLMSDLQRTTFLTAEPPAPIDGSWNIDTTTSFNVSFRPPSGFTPSDWTVFYRPHDTDDPFILHNLTDTEALEDSTNGVHRKAQITPDNSEPGGEYDVKVRWAPVRWGLGFFDLGMRCCSREGWSRMVL